MLITANRSFRLLWSGQLISQIGDKIYAVALMWWLLALTASPKHPQGEPAMLGYLMVAASLPALFGPFMGTLIDRRSRKHLLILADIGRGVLVLGMAALAQAQSQALWPIFLLTFGASVFTILFNPCIQTVIPAVVEPKEIGEALAWQSMTRDSANIFGAAAGGLLIAATGVVAGFGINAASFLLSALLIAMMTVRQNTPAAPASTPQQIKEGLAFVRSDRTIFYLLLVFSSMNLFLVPVFVMIPAIAKVLLHGTAATLGLLEASLACGSLLMAVTVCRIRRSNGRHRLILGALITSGLAGILLGLCHVLPVALTALFILGGCMAAVNINMRSVFQELVADEMKGRFFALVETIAYASFPLGFFLAGVGSTWLSIPVLLLACGAGSLLVALAALGVPGITKL